MQPISQNNPNLFKGPSTSEQFNKLQNDIHYDLSRLFTIANDHDQAIKDNMDKLIRENFFLQNKINELSDLLDKIQTDYVYKEQGDQKQQLIQSMYTLDGISLNSNAPASVDTLYGVATIQDTSRLSKVMYKNDDGTTSIPSSFQMSLLESNNTQPFDSNGMRTYYTVADLTIGSAFDGSNNTIWSHTSSFSQDSNITEVYGILHLTLPLNILNNVFANIITLHPYPEYSMTIADIQYKGYGNTWYRLPNFPKTVDGQGNESPIPIKNASKLIFSFPKTEITEVQIMFTQPHWFLNEGKRDFVYGFQDIGIEYRAYSNTIAEFISEFSIEDTHKRFYVIEQPVVTPNSGSEQDISDLVSHKLYYSSDLTSEFQFGNEILAPIQKVYIKTTLQGQGDIVPMVKNVKLNYVYKDMSDT